MTDPCLRCLTGVDDDDDGNCGYCAGLSDERVTVFRNYRLKIIQAWIEQARRYLSAAYDRDSIFIPDGKEFLKGPQ